MFKLISLLFTTIKDCYLPTPPPYMLLEIIKVSNPIKSQISELFLLLFIAVCKLIDSFLSSTLSSVVTLFLYYIHKLMREICLSNYCRPTCLTNILLLPNKLIPHCLCDQYAKVTFLVDHSLVGHCQGTQFEDIHSQVSKKQTNIYSKQTNGKFQWPITINAWF